jgi:hypothetical protein
MELLHWLFQTDASIAALVLRISLAVVIFPRRAESARLVWRPWLQWNYEVLRRLRNSRAIGGPCHGRRVSRTYRACRRIFNAHRRARHRLRHACGHGQSSLAIRFFPKLVRQSKRRGDRIPLACARRRHRSDDRRWRGLVARRLPCRSILVVREHTERLIAN